MFPPCGKASCSGHLIPVRISNYTQIEIYWKCTVCLRSVTY